MPTSTTAFFHFYYNELFTPLTRILLLIISVCLSPYVDTFKIILVVSISVQDLTKLCYLLIDNTESNICEWTLAFHYWLVFQTYLAWLTDGYESVIFQSRPYLVQLSHKGIPVRYLLESDKSGLSIVVVCLLFKGRSVSFFTFLGIDIHCKNPHFRTFI